MNVSSARIVQLQFFFVLVLVLRGFPPCFLGLSAVWLVLLQVSVLFASALQSNKSETDRRTDQTADQAKNMAENRRKIKISKDYVAEISYYVTGFWSFDVSQIEYEVMLISLGRW